ncbi:MAG: flippase-like domain-containing protein [Caldilineaceae bacterium]|nr:flippase-like domain-containing protein [Caldilineaceae bacterium]
MEKQQIKRYLQVGLPVLMVVALILGAIKYVNGREVLNALQQFNYSYSIPILMLSMLYLIVISWRFVVLLRALTAVRWHVPFKSFIASQPGLLIPGGLALRASLLNQAGVPVGRGSVPVLLSSLLDQVAFLAIAMVAALWFPPARTPVLVVLALFALAGGALAVTAIRKRVLQGGRWLRRKLHVEEQWQQFRTDLPKSFTWSVLGPTLGLTAISLGLTVLILDLNVRAFNQSVPYHALLLAFVLPTMLGRLVPILPGGIGVTEASMVGVLVSVAALSTHAATAIVIIFRIATIFFQAMLGAVVYFFLWRGQKENVQVEPAS